MLTLLILLWAALVLAMDTLHFVLLTPEAYTGIEAASVLSRFFGALVLLLFPSERFGPRLRWVAAGFIVLGLGGILFRFAWPPAFDELTRDQSVYASIVVWTVAGIMFVAALVPLRVTRSTRVALVGVPATGIVLGAVALATYDVLPALVTGSGANVADIQRDAPLSGLSGWHWLLSAVPLLLSVTAAAGAFYHHRRGELGTWLVAAMLLLAGSQLHNLFWPSAYLPILTTSDVLRMLFAGTVVIGGIVELRRIAAERAALLAIEQEYNARLSELATLKSDFTAMVAHELQSPLAALRALTVLLRSQDMPGDQRSAAVASVERQIDLLATLSDDVADIAAIERTSFDVDMQPVPIERILMDIEAYGATFASQRAVSVSGPHGVVVRADRGRIGQVHRNLLNNAFKYSPEDAPVDVRARVDGARVRFEVTDQGHGIPESEHERIFEFSVRGSTALATSARGAGLGLYLSRHIVRAHGSDLRVASRPGEGSVFSFELEIVS